MDRPGDRLPVLFAGGTAGPVEAGPEDPGGVPLSGGPAGRPGLAGPGGLRGPHGGWGAGSAVGAGGKDAPKPGPGRHRGAEPGGMSDPAIVTSA